jgi:Tfp pilus assembly PilM family ATPase
LAFEGLLEDLKDRLQPLMSRMFPKLVLLEIRDSGLQGQVLRDDDQPGPLGLRAPLPALTCRDGMPLEKDSLADLIGDLLLSEKQLDAYVLAVLPFEACHWRVLVRPFPEPPDDPIETLRLLDPQLNLPFSLAEAILDLQPLPGQSDEMLLVASPRRLVEGWIDVFRLAGVKLERLAPAQGCLLAALEEPLRSCEDTDLMAVLVPEENDCLLWLFHRGMPVFERALPLGGDDLIEEMQRCVAFYHRQEPTLRRLRLVLTGPLDDRAALEAALGVEAEELPIAPFGSLLLRGLAIREGRR